MFQEHNVCSYVTTILASYIVNYSGTSHLKLKEIAYAVMYHKYTRLNIATYLYCNVTYHVAN